ncbi:hypothetical protein Q0Z83_039050 [Actinoplanes sichuanensis]|uniref:Uncharacterized protein n=1 Tax=Actinoplanes sichuanensis TaxID=512349 RepID=A0ABW4AT23_9ACTN|nr:hypothetical protein [Actinoplanes sichuanensis]BEL05714.1 hypothetical protein Q0Z83_039050 [Actinoplanes sichuanensis]
MSVVMRRIDRFGFGEFDDMDLLAQTADTTEIERILRALVRAILHDEQVRDSLSDEAQADLLVPLGMATRVLDAGNRSAVELVSAACTVRYCAQPHRAELPADIAELLARLPR